MRPYFFSICPVCEKPVYFTASTRNKITHGKCYEIYVHMQKNQEYEEISRHKHGTQTSNS